ncbi:MAG: hypothetical protein ACXVEC_11830 [Nocardioides sp.]
MTAAHRPAQPTTRLAYDDASTPQEMSADCRAIGADPRFHKAVRAVTDAPPSLHFEDYPREVAKRDITISAAATRLANALELHLD